MIWDAYLSSNVKYNLIAGVYMMRLNKIAKNIDNEPVISAAHGNIEAGIKNDE